MKKRKGSIIITASIGALLVLITVTMLTVTLNGSKKNTKSIGRITDEYLMESIVDVQAHLLTNYFNNTEINCYLEEQGDKVVFRGSDKFMDLPEDMEVPEIGPDSLQIIKNTVKGGARFNNIDVKTYAIFDDTPNMYSLVSFYKDISSLKMNKGSLGICNIPLKDFYYRTIITYKARQVIIDYCISSMYLVPANNTYEYDGTSGDMYIKRMKIDTTQNMNMSVIGMRYIDL